MATKKVCVYCARKADPKIFHKEGTDQYPLRYFCSELHKAKWLRLGRTRWNSLKI